MVFQTLKGLATFLLSAEEMLMEENAHCYVVVESPSKVVVYDEDGDEITRAESPFYYSPDDELLNFRVNLHDGADERIQNRFAASVDRDNLLEMVRNKKLRKRNLVGQSFHLSPKIYFDEDVFQPLLRATISGVSRSGMVSISVGFDNKWYHDSITYTKWSMESLLKDHKGFLVLT